MARRNPVGAINIDVPMTLLRQDPDLAVLTEHGQCYWQGPGGSCAAGPVRDTDTFNVIWDSEERLGSQGEWFMKGDLPGVIDKFKDWDPKLLKIVRLAKPDDCFVWNITDLPPLPTVRTGGCSLFFFHFIPTNSVYCPTPYGLQYSTIASGIVVADSLVH